MARPLRIEYDGAWYHVMNRGLERRTVFVTDADRQRFLKLLHDVCDIFAVEVHAFSLMGNHYHLLVHTPASGLGRAMQHLNGVYTQSFNKAHRRDGPLFRGRYKALLIDSDEYLWAVTRYIHLNPVAAGLASKAEDHVWSSHRCYLRSSQAPSWLHTDKVLARFGSGSRAIRAFNNYVNAVDDKSMSDSMTKAKGGILGGVGFREWAYSNFVSDRLKKDRGIPKKIKRVNDDPGIETLIRRIAFVFHMPVKALKQSRRRVRNDARTAAAFLLRKVLGLSLEKIGRHLNMGSDAVAQSIHRMRKRMANDRKLEKLIGQIHIDHRKGDEIPSHFPE